jgi:hypothetical protein
MTSDERGQSLVEFALASGFAALIAVGGGSLFIHEWNRVRCAHLVFEATHARLVGGAYHGHEVAVSDTPLGVQGTGRCGRAFEQVELSKLEAEITAKPR